MKLERLYFLFQIEKVLTMNQGERWTLHQGPP